MKNTWIRNSLGEMRGQEWWDDWFLGLARYVAGASKDPSTQVGAVIADQDKRIVSMGFNGFPKGVADDARLNVRDEKMAMVLHAEANAILFAERSLNGCTIYTWPFQPCSHCAAMIIQSGIKRVVFSGPSPAPERWAESCVIGQRMFAEAGVEYVRVEGGPSLAQ